MIDYFTQERGFYETISLHDRKELTWEKAQAIAPLLPKGWWELSRLDQAIIREFIHDFWLNALPYLPHIYHYLDAFFAEVKEVGIYLSQKQVNRPFEVFFTYSLKERLFLGKPPLLEKDIQTFKRSIDFPIPDDFLNFLRIHNGFSKGEDTGIFPSYTLQDVRKRFKRKQAGLYLENRAVDPELLFPFYQSFNLDSYQCFYKDWYPDGEVGNVLCSLTDKTISCWKEEETLAFPTFLDWLVFYLE